MQALCHLVLFLYVPSGKRLQPSVSKGLNSFDVKKPVCVVEQPMMNTVHKTKRETTCFFMLFLFCWRLKKSGLFLQKMLRNFPDEAGGFEADDSAVALAPHFGRTEKEVVLGAGDGDIKESALFGVAVFFH